MLFAAVLVLHLQAPHVHGQVLLQELLHIDPEDGPVGDLLGADIHVNGDLAIIGALGDGPGLSGAVYIFRRINGTWVQDGPKITSPDPAPHNEFTMFGIGTGVSPSSHGDVAIIGAVFATAHVGSPDQVGFAGAAYIYRHDSQSGLWEFEQKLEPPTLALFDFFGARASISGDYAIVGAPNADPNGLNSGSFYVFKYDPANAPPGAGPWIEVVSNAAPADVIHQEQIGTYVAIDALRDDPLLVVSAQQKRDYGNGSGASYVYRLAGATDEWELEQRLDLLLLDEFNDPLLTELDFFGGSPAISGDVVAVAARNAAVDGIARAGEVHVFRRIEGIWTFEQTLRPDPPLERAGFGETVAMDGDLIICGEGWEPTNEPGGAFVFRFDGTEWLDATGRLLHAGAQKKDLAYVGLFGPYAFVGAPFADTVNGAETGLVSVYYIFNSPEGENVSIQPVDAATGSAPATLQFESILASGTTTIEILEEGPEPPSGFSIGDPATYYEITTTAEFEGLITICFDYSGVSYIDESDLRLLHFVDGEWMDVTTYFDMENKIICGVVESFSPFIIVEVQEPLNPVVLLTTMINHVAILNLHHGIHNSLDAKLSAASNALSDVNQNNDVAAINAIEAFINAVSAQSGTHIPAPDAADLINQAQFIIDVLLLN